MKAYHLRTKTQEYTKDYIYAPEKNLFVALCQQDGFYVKMNYSEESYLSMAQGVVENRDDNNSIDLKKPKFVVGFELAEESASKIKKNIILRLNGTVFDGTPEGLVKMLSEEPKQKSNY